MKVLIIDNGTSYLQQLENLLSKHAFQVIKYSEIGSVDLNDFDAIILSGGHAFTVEGHTAQLEKEIDLVKESTRPIFGICFGFEVIAQAFGAKLELMKSKEHGILDIEVIESDDIFLNINSFQVFESHRWVVKELPKDFISLARSKDGIEAIKHKTRPVYAVQFHPEMFTEESCGDEIFNNFLNIIQKESLRRATLIASAGSSTRLAGSKLSDKQVEEVSKFSVQK